MHRTYLCMCYNQENFYINWQGSDYFDLHRKTTEIVCEESMMLLKYQLMKDVLA